MSIIGIISTLVLTGSSFWGHWGDSKAEINSYEVVQSRYGEERKCRSVLIYVTEPFNLEKQVKSDVSGKGNPQIVNVLKLNRIKHFQTGIYDYSLMTSVFVALGDYKTGRKSWPGGTPIKLAFTSQEWCGTMFHQLNRRSEGMQSRSFSYFESESDSETMLACDERSYFADNLFIDVRELVRPMPTGTITLYQTLETGRLLHRTMQKMSATVEKNALTSHMPKGDRAANQWRIRSGDKVWEFVVEAEYPNKILAYEYREGSSVIEKGTLQESIRLPYWKLNSEGDELYLKKLGL